MLPLKHKFKMSSISKTLVNVSSFVFLGITIIFWFYAFLTRDNLVGIRAGISLLLFLSLIRIPVQDDEENRALVAENDFLRRILRDPEFRKGIVIASKALESEQTLLGEEPVVQRTDEK